MVEIKLRRLPITFVWDKNLALLKCKHGTWDEIDKSTFINKENVQTCIFKINGAWYKCTCKEEN